MGQTVEQQTLGYRLRRTAASDRLMSIYPMLIGGGYHEAMHALDIGLLLKRTAAHIFS